MSTSTSAETVPATRPARWPWLLVGLFVVFATLGTVLVVANGEPVVGQVSYLVAFSMFAVVGALIVSRDRRNRIGILLMWSALVTGMAFVTGELTTWFVTEGHSGPFVVAAGLLNGIGWGLGVLAVVFFLPLLFPDGRLPSPRWRIYVWFVIGFLALLLISLVFGQKTLTGSGDTGLGSRTRFYIRAVGDLPTLDPAIAILLPGALRADDLLPLPAVPPFVRGRATADQVGGVRVPQRARAHDRQRRDQGSGPERVHRRHRLPRLPGLDRGRGAAVPPLRPGRRREEGGGVRRARGVRHARLPGARRRARCLAREGQLVPHHGRGGDRRGHVPAGTRTSQPVREPGGVREARDALRAPHRFLRARGRGLRGRRRPAADGPRARGGDRRRTERRLAGGGVRTPPGGGVAGGDTGDRARADAQRVGRRRSPRWIACTSSSTPATCSVRWRCASRPATRCRPPTRSSSRGWRRRRGSCSATSASRRS